MSAASTDVRVLCPILTRRCPYFAGASLEFTRDWRLGLTDPVGHACPTENFFRTCACRVWRRGAAMYSVVKRHFAILKHKRDWNGRTNVRALCRDANAAKNRYSERWLSGSHARRWRREEQAPETGCHNQTQRWIERGQRVNCASRHGAKSACNFKRWYLPVAVTGISSPKTTTFGAFSKGMQSRQWRRMPSSDSAAPSSSTT